jgi:hypothetical protein
MTNLFKGLSQNDLIKITYFMTNLAKVFLMTNY